MRKALVSCAVSLLIAVLPTTAAAAVAGTPWGPVHVLRDGRSSTTISQAATTTGITVVAYRPIPRQGPSPVMIAIQVRGLPWSAPFALSSGAATRPTVIAWGDGHLSVIWESPAGQDTYRFHARSLQADGTLGPAETLLTAQYAYPVYQAAINSAGEIGLAWSDGDLFDRVVIRHTDGTVTHLPAVPVHHPTSGGLQLIANPKALFLDDKGRVSDLTWGTLDGSDRAIWLMRPDGSDGWTSQLVAPLQGGELDYGYVDEADYAADTRGDLAVSWQQRDPTTKDWSTELRYAAAGGKLGAAKILGDEYCFIDNESPCASVTVAADGTTTAAYGSAATGDNLVVDVVRRTPDGSFSAPEPVSAPIWVNSYDGVQAAGNRRGDAVVSFSGGNHHRFWTQFARCPAGAACTTALRRQNDPSWLDSWVTSMGPSAGVTLTWLRYYRDGVSTRYLAP